MDRDDYFISDDATMLDLDAVHGFLSRSYWATGIPRTTVEKSVRHSMCFGVYTAERRQVGFARVITDRATFAYLCDVYIDEGHRGKGLSKRLMEAVLAHPDLQGLRRFCLLTRDAQGLYAQFGFSEFPMPSRFLHRHDPDVYQRG